MNIDDIKFRGKRKDTGEWVFGDLIHSHYEKEKVWIQNAVGKYEVQYATVGQFTGETLRGKDLYQGDALRMDNVDPEYMQIRFIEGAFCLCAVEDIINDETGKISFEEGEFIMDIHYIHHADHEQADIIGTVHDEVKPWS